MISKLKRHRVVVMVLGLLLSVMLVAWLLGAHYFGSGSQSQTADANAPAVTEMLLDVNLEAGITDRLETMVDAVRTVLRSKRIGYRDLGVAKDRVIFELRDGEQASAALQAVSTVFPDLVMSEKNGRIEIAPTDEALAVMRHDGLQQTYRVLERRLTDVGAILEEIRIQGSRCIVVRGSFPDMLRGPIYSIAKLTLQPFVGEVDPPLIDGPAGQEVLPSQENSKADQPTTYYAVSKRVLFSGDHIVEASVDVEHSRPFVTARVDYGGRMAIANRLPDPNQRVAVVLDSRVIAVVRLAAHPPDGLNLHSDFTMEQAVELADLLTAVILGWPVEQVEKCPDENLR